MSRWLAYAAGTVMGTIAATIALYLVVWADERDRL